MCVSDLTRSRARACKEQLGGNSTLYLYDDLADAFTVSAGNEATAMNAALTANYSYELEGDGNTLEEVMVGDRNTGTRVNTQTLTVVLKKMTAADAAEFNLLAASFAQAVVKDRNGNYKALGLRKGMDWTVTASTGSAMGDLSGYTIVGTAQESKLAPTLDAATITAFEAVTVAV